MAAALRPLAAVEATQYERHQSRMQEGHQSKMQEGHQSRMQDRHQSRIQEGHQSKMQEGIQSKMQEGHQSKMQERHQSKMQERHQSKMQEGQGQRTLGKDQERRGEQERKIYQQRAEGQHLWSQGSPLKSGKRASEDEGGERVDAVGVEPWNVEFAR